MLDKKTYAIYYHHSFKVQDYFRHPNNDSHRKLTVPVIEKKNYMEKQIPNIARHLIYLNRLILSHLIRVCIQI
jgi:hypothetical protein